MSDFFVRLIESARGAPPPVRAAAPLAIDDEVEVAVSAVGAPAAPNPPRTVVPGAAPPTVGERAEAPSAPGRRSAAPTVAPAARDVPQARTIRQAPTAPRERVGVAASPLPTLAPTQAPLPVAVGRRRSSAPSAMAVRERSAQVTPAAAGVEAQAERPASAVGPAPGGPPTRVAPSPVAPLPAATEEVVHVSIGRIEVRVTPPAPVVAAVRAAPARPRQSLDEYLAARDRGRR